MTGRKFVNGVDTKFCVGGAVLRCWGFPSGVLPGFANPLLAGILINQGLQGNPDRFIAVNCVLFAANKLTR